MREWAVYEKLEPFERERIDYNLAKIDFVIRTIVSKKGHGPKFEDCLIKWDGGGSSESERQTPAQMRAILAAQLGGRKAKAKDGTKHGHRKPKRSLGRDNESVQ